jgi:hypothetical protein
LKLEFGKIYLIHRIRIYYRFRTNWFFRDDHCTVSDLAFMDCVDKNNNVDVSVYKGDVKQKSCGTLKLTYGLEQSDQIYTLICNTEGDTVKLSKDTGRLALFEIVVTWTGKTMSSIPHNNHCKASMTRSSISGRFIERKYDIYVLDT